MSTLATSLKHEITRLARKEIRSQVEPLKKASTRHRREIAELKRSVAQLSRTVSDLERQLSRGRATHSVEPKPAAPAATWAEGGPRYRFSPSWLRVHRDRIAVSAADYAKLIGVSSLTIYNWEHEKTRPRAKQIAALAEVRKLGKREAWRTLEKMEAAEA